MKVGSLVEAIKPTLGLTQWNEMIGIPITIGEILTIRNIEKDIMTNAELIMFEEIVNKTNGYTGQEFGYRPERFRELQPPISNIEEHIKENTLEPLLT